MEEKRNRRFSMLSIISVLCIVFMQGVFVESLECLFCSDRGDGSCLENAVQNISCSQDHNMCVEAVTAMETSDNQYIILGKGCGTGLPTRTERAITFHGITAYMLATQCNTSMCNNEFQIKNFQLPPVDIRSYYANEAQCYSCIGKSKDECTPSKSPVNRCYESLNNCFDGNITVTVGNTTEVVPIKSCSQNEFCAAEKFDLGAAKIEIKGACCKENLCNQDLSNKTQYMELPPLVLITPPVVESSNTTAIPPDYTKPAHEHPGSNEDNKTHGLTETHGDKETYNDTKLEGNSNFTTPSDEASLSLISPWLLCFALVLSKL